MEIPSTDPAANRKQLLAKIDEQTTKQLRESKLHVKEDWIPGRFSLFFFGQSLSSLPN